MKLIPYALLTLGAIFGFVLAWSLNQIWKATFGLFFTTLGNLGISIPIPRLPDVSIHPFSFLLKFNNDVVNFLGGMVANSEHAMVELFAQTVRSFLAVAAELGNLAEAVEQKFVTLVAATIPHLIRGALGGLWAQVKRIPGLVRRVEHLLGYLEKKIKAGIQTAIHAAIKQLKNVGKYAKGLASSALKSVINFAKRLGNLEQKLVGKKLASLFHKGLKSLKLGWLFAVNVERFAQWLVVQGAPEVYEFVKDALTVIGETDMCKLAAYNYDVAVYVFEPMMMQLVGVTDWFCSHKNEGLATGMEDKPGYSLAWAPSATPPITGPYTPARLAPSVPLPRGVVGA